MVGVLHMAILRIEGELKGQDDARTVAGQLVSGGSVAAVVATCMYLADWTSLIVSMVIGALIGYAVSLMTLVVNLFFEKPSGAGESRTILPTASKCCYGLLVGVLVFLISWKVVLLRTNLTISVIVICLQIVVMKLILVERPVVLADPTNCGADKPQEGKLEEVVKHSSWDASPTFHALTTRSCLPGMVGVPLSAIVGGQLLLMSNFITISTGKEVKSMGEEEIAKQAFGFLLVATILGVFCGLIAGLAVNSILDNPPMIIGLFGGLAACVGTAFWNGLVAVVVGPAFGLALASLFEQRIVLNLKERDMINRKELVAMDVDTDMDANGKRGSTMARTGKREDALDNIIRTRKPVALMLSERSEKSDKSSGIARGVPLPIGNGHSTTPLHAAPQQQVTSSPALALQAPPELLALEGPAIEARGSDRSGAGEHLRLAANLGESALTPLTPISPPARQSQAENLATSPNAASLRTLPAASSTKPLPSNARDFGSSSKDSHQAGRPFAASAAPAAIEDGFNLERDFGEEETLPPRSHPQSGRRSIMNNAGPGSVRRAVSHPNVAGSASTSQCGLRNGGGAESEPELRDEDLFGRWDRRTGGKEPRGVSQPESVRQAARRPQVRGTPGYLPSLWGARGLAPPRPATLRPNAKAVARN